MSDTRQVTSLHSRHHLTRYLTHATQPHIFVQVTQENHLFCALQTKLSVQHTGFSSIGARAEQLLHKSVHNIDRHHIEYQSLIFVHLKLNSII